MWGLIQDFRQAIFRRLERRPSAPGRRANVVVALVPVLVVLITFLFWYQTWFGRPLSDDEMTRCLTDTSVPHQTQHALSQLADRIARRDPAAARWYPEVIRLAASRQTGFRLMAAWVMGQDGRSSDFHRALLPLVADPEPMVRWNAALALARFGDSSGDEALRGMLRPYKLLAPLAGTLAFQVKGQDTVRRGDEVAQIQASGAAPVKVLSPVDGVFARQEKPDGARAASGEEIAVLSPSPGEVWEALRALYLIGGAEDLADVERFARGVPGMPERVREQAALTAQAIRKRVGARGR